MNPNRTEEARRRGLAFSLSLIADYEASELRAREQNPPHLRTAEEVHRECDRYRREARHAWGFASPDGVADTGEDTAPPL